MTSTVPPNRTVPSRMPDPVVVNAVDVDAGPRGFDFNRVSLRAIIAGTIVALITMIALTILGLSVGATTLDALLDMESDPAFEMATGAVVWLVATMLISLFLGGWVSGRLAGVPNGTDGALHGLVTFGLVSLLTLWMFTSSAARAVSGAANVVGEGITALTDGVETVAPAAADAVERQEFTLEQIRSEARSLAADTGEPSLQPDALEQQGEEAGEIAGETAEGVLTNPANAGQEIERGIERLFNLNAIEDTDRDSVVNLMVTRGGMTEQEARETLQRWEDTYNQATANAEQTIEDATESLAEAIALAAGVMFMALVVGAFAGGAGGFVGAPEPEDLAEEAREIEMAA